MHQEYTITLRTPVCAGGLNVSSGAVGFSVAGVAISLRGEAVLPGFWVAPQAVAAAVGKCFSIAAAAADRLYSYYEEKAVGFAVTVTAAVQYLRRICKRSLRGWHPFWKWAVFQRKMRALSRAGGLRL